MLWLCLYLVDIGKLGFVEGINKKENAVDNEEINKKTLNPMKVSFGTFMQIQLSENA